MDQFTAGIFIGAVMSLLMLPGKREHRGVRLTGPETGGTKPDTVAKLAE